MERINLERIISESTKQTIQEEVDGFVDKDKFQIFYGMVHVESEEEPSGVIVSNIIDTVCKYYKVNSFKVLSTTRRMPLIKYRQMILYLVRKYTDLSFKDIGYSVCHLDHATVIHSIKSIQNYLDQDKRFVNQMNDIEESILYSETEKP